MKKMNLAILLALLGTGWFAGCATVSQAKKDVQTAWTGFQALHLEKIHPPNDSGEATVILHKKTNSGEIAWDLGTKKVGISFLTEDISKKKERPSFKTVIVLSVVITGHGRSTATTPRFERVTGQKIVHVITPDRVVDAHDPKIIEIFALADDLATLRSNKKSGAEIGIKGTDQEIQIRRILSHIEEHYAPPITKE